MFHFFGLVPAILVSVGLAMAAGGRLRLKRFMVASAVILAIAVFVFGYLLSNSIPLLKLGSFE
jgi:hypothetical protein